MKSAWTLLAGSALIAVTIATGIAHGRLIGRWGAQTDVVSGAKLLAQVPDRLGDWHNVRSDDLAPDMARVLQCTGNIIRVYENTRTGDRVSIAVLLGPAGPISVHTPEICYSSRDYQITHKRSVWSPQSSTEDSDAFWDLRLSANDVSTTPLRVIYGWTNRKNWQATEQPRFSYGGSPYLYKLQLAGPAPKEKGERDVCGAFLSEFLPVLRNHMIDR